MIGTSHPIGQIPAAIAAQACSRRITEIILHHTWAPTAVQYRGKPTIEGIHRYHTVDNGWSDIGYHYLVSPDGLLWLGRPLSRDGAHVSGKNAGTIGVSMILNGDVETPGVPQIAATGMCLRVLLQRFGLRADVNFGAGRGFHRDYSSKTCPGTKISKAQVIGWCSAVSDTEPPEAEPDDGGNVPATWAADAWDWALAAGLLDGTRPRDTVTRQELAVVCQRLKVGG
jgi:hypothetical protein